MAETRVTTTTTGQYDLLLAISQDAVNDALANMWDVDSKGMTDIVIDGNTVGVSSNLKGKILAPDMQVIADGTGRGSVLFRLNFESGTLNIWDADAGELQTKDMNGYKIAFKVDLALNDVHSQILGIKTQLSNSDIKPAVKQKLEAELKVKEDIVASFGKQAGDFSINQLFVNMATADISSLPEAELVLPGMDEVQKATFGTLITLWLARSKAKHSTTLGYSLAVDPAKAKNYKVADCLMPTSVNLQTYPYKASPTADPELGWTGDAARNCVVYCNMTEQRQIQGERQLAWSGNFTTINFDREHQVDGTAIIKRELFLDKFVVPLLRQYNDDFQMVATYMHLTRDGDAGQRRYHWKYECKLGYNPSNTDWTSDYFSFSRSDPGANLSGLQSRRYGSQAKQDGFDMIDTAEGVSWSWSKSCNPGRQENNQDWHNFLKGGKDAMDWVDNFSGEISSDSCVYVVPVPGKGVIKLRGYTQCQVNIKGTYERLAQSWLQYEGDIGVFAHWQVDIVCSSSETDGMKCKFANQKVFKYNSNSTKGIPASENLSEQFISCLSSNLDKMLAEKDAIAQAINDALSATGKFSHPATGSFDLKDPCFNRRGDIMVTASYKAPTKNRNNFQGVIIRSLPELGQGAVQRAPGAIGQNYTAVGDMKGDLLGKKGK